jgi:hypothetical protein
VSRAADADVRSLSDAERRALTERILVLPPRLAPRQDSRSGLFHAIGESGGSYTVDPALGSCTCPDAKYRDRKCKHLRRVEFETGERPVPAWADAGAVPQFRRFVSARAPEDSDE